MQILLDRLESLQQDHLNQLFAFLRYPSISTDPAAKSDLVDCAEHLRSQLEKLGMDEAVLHETAGHPIVTASWRKKKGAPTVLIYGHYDVQPVDPLELWDSPPFEPVVRDERIVARGSMDDKGQLFAHVKALETCMDLHGELPVNVVCLFEGEEEIGSPNLLPFLRENADLLKADCVVVSDTAMFAKGRPSITYGLKGLCYMELRVDGPVRDLHSGSFGGPVLNPLNVMADLLSSLKDADGRVAVKGFYDAVKDLSEKERAAFAALDFDENAYKAELEVQALQPEAGFTPLEHLWARPTCDVNGMWGGFMGEGAKTVLPSYACAKVSFRLVPDQLPERVADCVEAHLIEHAPKGVRLTVTRHHGGPPAIVPMGHSALAAGMDAMEKAFGVPAVYQREGGSIPVVGSFEEILGLKTVLMGFGLPDSHCHSPNENLALDCFYGGIRAAAWFYHLLPSYLKECTQ
jgi:acetylornithine deacetylase/succinyl-diaminopimelate desuccinylase-like protein